MNTRAVVVVFVALSMSGVAAAQTPESPQTPAGAPPAPRFEEAVEVVATTPIHGLGIARDKIPSNIQAASAGDLGRTGGTQLAEQINLASPSVHVNEATSNPFQPDLQFRGFTGSPLLGLPQGIAVYQDGVRLNEPFGDTVNWDLLPGNAVAGIALMPGSNPLFGLNALGGAISLQTKTGFSHPGHAARVSSGAFGRQLVEAESGGRHGGLSYFVAGAALAEDGWRDFSPSRVRQLFGDLEWRGAASMLSASVTSGRNTLIGNGAAPIELLEENRRAIFTFPDETKTRMTLVSVRGQHTPAGQISLDGMVFYRRATINAFNGDGSDYGECAARPFTEYLCADEGEGDPVKNQFGRLIPVDDDAEFNGTNNTSGTRTNGWGGALQTTVTRPVAGRDNHFVAGVTFDGGRSRYQADTEIARLTDERGTIGSGFFDEEAVVRLRTQVRHSGVFAADFLSIAPRVTLMGAARFNQSVVELRDQVGTDLNGDHTFSRVNPALGITVQMPQSVTAFGSVSVSSRVPAPSELSCADPEDPCRLPNAFVADPPLEQVVARTVEGGLRGRGRGVTWNASLFRTAVRDDIVFISSGALTNTGHFANLGDTLRQGIEISASGALRDAVRWGAAYSYLQARFQTPLTLSSPNHPDADDGEIAIEAGDAIPSVPAHNLKLNVSSTIRRATVGANLLATSRQFLRGDEANLLPALEGAAVVNLTGSYAVSSRVRLFARVANLFDRKYATFGLLGEAGEVLGDDYQDPRFLSPAAPRAAWVGVELAFR